MRSLIIIILKNVIFKQLSFLFDINCVSNKKIYSIFTLLLFFVFLFWLLRFNNYLIDYKRFYFCKVNKILCFVRSQRSHAGDCYKKYTSIPIMRCYLPDLNFLKMAYTRNQSLINISFQHFLT